MTGAIFGTAAVCCVGFLVFMLRRAELDAKKKCRALERENHELNEWLGKCERFEDDRRIRETYRRGLYDGRETSTPYRELVRDFRSSKRIEDRDNWLHQRRLPSPPKEESREKAGVA